MAGFGVKNRVYIKTRLFFSRDCRAGCLVPDHCPRR